MQTIKGFSDYTGEQAQRRAKIKKIIEETFQLYGFEPAETPIIEQEEFVKGDNQEDEAVSDIFKLQDKGKRKLALRYEFTFQLKRIAKNKKLPYKRYQIGPVFRDEPVSVNRFRQFTQCDVDIIGSSIKDEAEILATTKKILDNLGIKSEIIIGNRELLNEILEEQGIKKNKEQVLREIDKLDKLSEKEVRANLKKLKTEKILNIIKKSENFFKKYKAYEDVDSLKKSCALYGIKIKFQPSLVRGLSYYNKNVYEIRPIGKKDSLAGGGTFLIDGVQSAGISFGFQRWCSLAQISTNTTKAIIISINQDKRAIQLAENLRKNKIPCTISYKVSKALELANSNNIPLAIFVGEKEKPKYKLKNMDTGKEKLTTEKELIKKLSQ